MSLYPNLPGYEVDIQDGGLRASRPVTGPKVTVIGTTDNQTIALNTPTLLTRAEDAVDFDLVNGLPSELSKAINEAFIGGADNVEAVITSYNTSLTALQRYTALATTYDTLLNTDLDIVVPAGVYIDSPGLTGSLNFGYQLADLCYQGTVNNNTTIGVIGVAAPTAAAATTGTLSLTDLETHVAALEDFNTSALQGASFTIYDGVTDTGNNGVPDVYGFIATTDRLPAVNPADGRVITDSRGNFVDIGAYISVVATWGKITGDVATALYPVYGYYNAPLAAVYAGLISRLDSASAPTNKVVNGVVPLRELSLSQANRLTGARFVSMITKPRGLVVADAMTGAYNISRYYKSDFTRLTTVRIVHDALNVVRLIADPFIGEPNNAATRNALDVGIGEGLQKLRSLGFLEDFDYSIVSTPAMRVLGEVLVDMVLVPAFELRKIRVKIALSPAKA